MKKEERLYKNKDVDMLMVCATIVESAKVNEKFLAEKRKTWEPPYFSNLAIEIDTVFNQYLGVDSAKKMRYLTQVVMEIKHRVDPLLSEIKVQIMEDFKTEPIKQKEILTTLGFQSYRRAAQGDQEALINLLYDFQTNIGQHESEMIEKGISENTIRHVIDSAQKLKDSNVEQENQKSHRKEITAEGISNFNAIFSKVISLCKIARSFYKDQPLIQEQFSFTKVSKSLNYKPKKVIIK